MIGGYLEYCGESSVDSTVRGYHDKCGGYPEYCGGMFSIVGDIMSTVLLIPAFQNDQSNFKLQGFQVFESPTSLNLCHSKQ